MKLAYHGATHMASDITTDIQVSGQAGFRAIELWAGKIDQYLKGKSVPELRQLLTGHGVEAASINSIEFIGFRGNEYQQIKQRCKQLCEIAEAIECPMIVVVPSPTPKTSDTDPGFDWEKIVAEYVNVLRDLGSIAQGYGVQLTFEFIGFGWSSVRTPRGAYEIVQKTNLPNVGMTFDACHFYVGGGSLDEIDPVAPDKIYTFHINDMEDVPKEAVTDAMRLLPGLGVIALNDICNRLKQIGYDGLCSIELFRPEYWNRDPLELAQQARQAAMKVLEPYFNVE